MPSQIVLIMGGGIAAYKALEVIRLLRESGVNVDGVLTRTAQNFVTPLAVQTLAGRAVHTDLFALNENSLIDHITLSRNADLLLVCPASANLIARMATGLADDLATTLLLAADKPIFVAPAMNVRMWTHPATQENIRLLRDRGCHLIGPEEGEMACGEFGPGRLATPEQIFEAVMQELSTSERLKGKHVLVTAGPTFEPIDPVRFLGNRSSGKQGYAIAAAFAQHGARVTLVSGPTSLPCPPRVSRRLVSTASEMLVACEAALPADIAVCAAAVSDWRASHTSATKRKKGAEDSLVLSLVENPDILQYLSKSVSKRPDLVIGFAAETDNLEHHAREKLTRKGCDWILANSIDQTGHVFGSERNRIYFLTKRFAEHWPEMRKTDIAEALVERCDHHFSDPKTR